MARYIDAEKVNVRLLKAAGHETFMGSKGRGKGLRQAVDIVSEQPTADVIEVKHGHWSSGTVVYYDKNGMNFGYMCSVCEKCAKERSAYCCNCGAKMEVE